MDNNNMTPQQFDVIKELGLICTEHAFWLFMCMQSAIFNAQNKAIIRQQIGNFCGQWSNFFGKYYNQNDARIIRTNVNNFFDSYLSYLDSITNEEYGLCKDILNQWKYLGSMLAKDLASLNPAWNEMEWNGILSSQIDILDKEMQNNIQGNYSTINQSYNIYNRISNDLAVYLATGLIKQFSI